MYNQQIPPFGGGFGFRPQQPMQGYFPQQMQQPQQMAPQLSPAAPGVTLVTDRQQAELATIPFDGTPYYYHNTANDELYVKRFDGNTGRSPMITYRRIPEGEERPAFVLLEAFESLMQRVAALEGAANDYQPRRAKEANAE